jgi:hypothetical protein
MPGRQHKENYHEYHGKYKYISKNFQPEWKADDDKIEVKTRVETDDGDIAIPTEIPLKDQLDTKQKKKRRELIKKAHPDRGGSDEELKRVLDQHGD